MVQEHNKEIFIWKTRVFQFHLCQEKTGTEKVWFGHAFWCRVTNFKPHLLSPQKSKLKNFSAHQQEDFLRISKLTLLLFLVPILKELWQFETSGHFFWDTLYSLPRQNSPPKNRSLIGYSSLQHDPMIKSKGCSWKFRKFSLWWALKFSFFDQRELRKWR